MQTKASAAKETLSRDLLIVTRAILSVSVPLQYLKEATLIVTSTVCYHVSAIENGNLFEVFEFLVYVVIRRKLWR